MTAVSTFAKKASDHVPYCQDQGLPFLVAAAKSGVSLQSKTFVQTATGAFDFEAEGLLPMVDGAYAALMQNQSGVSVPKATAKTPTGFTMTGPAIGDVVDVVIVGQLKGQL